MAGTLTDAPHFLHNCWALAFFIEHHLLEGPRHFVLHWNFSKPFPFYLSTAFF